MDHNTDTVTNLPPARSLENSAQMWIVAMVALGMLVIVLAFTAAHALFAHEPPAAPRLPPDALRPTTEELRQLKIEPVRSGGDIDLVRASGSIAADGDHSTPILLPFSGQVVKVLVEPGQMVRAGQPLLRVASPEMVDARGALATATAQQAAAAAAVRVAQANASREKAIYETAGGALKDYTQAQTDLVAAQSALRTAASAVRAATDRLAIFGRSPGDGDNAQVGERATTPYRAPVSGIVADRNVAPGQFVAAGGTAPLMTITDPSHVWLVAQLSESDVASVRLGDRVTVTTPALPGRSFLATIDNIGAALDPVTHRLAVRATVANPGGALKPQMFASFVIQRRLPATGGVLVPARAVIHEGDGARVWVRGSDGLLYGRTVQVGETDGGWTRITAGLRRGEQVVTSGALFVNEAGLDG